MHDAPEMPEVAAADLQVGAGRCRSRNGGRKSLPSSRIIAAMPIGQCAFEPNQIIIVREQDFDPDSPSEAAPSHHRVLDPRHHFLGRPKCAAPHSDAERAIAFCIIVAELGGRFFELDLKRAVQIGHIPAIVFGRAKRTMPTDLRVYIVRDCGDHQSSPIAPNRKILEFDWKVDGVNWVVVRSHTPRRAASDRTWDAACTSGGLDETQ
jgi:hypothetical protein